MPLLAIGMPGPFELAIIAFIVILIFGVGRLPEVGGAVGKSIREFRKSTKDDEEKPADAVMQSAAPTQSAAQPQGAAPAASPDSIFCSECGSRNLRGAKFCAECGKAIQAPVG
jgi:sec-independent protein translocase protein TatA